MKIFLICCMIILLVRYGPTVWRLYSWPREFEREYGFHHNGVIIANDKPKRFGFIIQQSKYQYETKSGQRDTRFADANNPLIQPDSILITPKFTIHHKNPFIIYDQVVGLRQRGYQIPLAPWEIAEEKPYRDQAIRLNQASRVKSVTKLMKGYDTKAYHLAKNYLIDTAGASNPDILVHGEYVSDKQRVADYIFAVTIDGVVNRVYLFNRESVSISDAQVAYADACSNGNNPAIVVTTGTFSVQASSFLNKVKCRTIDMNTLNTYAESKGLFNNKSETANMHKSSDVNTYKIILKNHFSRNSRDINAPRRFT